MRKTLTEGDVIPHGAKWIETNQWPGRPLELVVEVPDPTPPAPKLIVFVADGEPRTYTTDAAPWRLDLSGQFGYLGAYDDQNNYRARAVQHYRQLPALTPELHELRNAWINTKKGSHAEAWFYEIIAAMESKEK